MEQIAVIGFGKQGIKAVAGISVSHPMVKSFFVDNDRDALSEYALKGQKVLIGFHYREGVWEPGCEIKSWLEDEENREVIIELVKKFSMLILVAGLGGTISLAAKELAAFLNREQPMLPVYFLCSLPFHEETDYQHNFLARKVLDFLRRGDVGWTVVENDLILPACEYDISKAYENSYMQMSYLLECILSVCGPGIWNSKIAFSDVVRLLERNLVHITILESEGGLLEYSEQQNEWLTYLPDSDSPYVLMSIELSKGIRLPGILKQMNRYFEERFSDQCNCACRIYYGKNVPYSYRVVLLSRGKEKRGRPISVREICIE